MKLVFTLLISLWSILLPGYSNAQKQVPVFELSIENLYHASENNKLTRLYFLPNRQTIAYRYGNSFPKDLLLLNSQRLVLDSLNLRNRIKKGLTVHALFEKSKDELYIIHSEGTSEISIRDGRFSLVKENVDKRKPKIGPEYLDSYELIFVGDQVIGYRANPKKWLDSPDYWVYDQQSDSFEIYKDSEFKSETKNRYWEIGSSFVPEPYTTYNYFTYYISKTVDGFLFNLPLKNRFLIYNSRTNTFQSYLFPKLKNRGDAWMVLYDSHMDRYFPVLEEGKRFKIYVLDKNKENYHLLGITAERPLEVVNGKVYVRKFVYKEKKEGWYFDHHLIDLYPKLN
ncbi:hypothetical protein [Algoriphagus namhaensis]